ncbi:hypothetical protein ACFTY8_30810 [Streptomyces mirabilis]
MTRVIGTMGDKLLGMLLKEDPAGACVPEQALSASARTTSGMSSAATAPV